MDWRDPRGRGVAFIDEVVRGDSYRASTEKAG